MCVLPMYEELEDRNPAKFSRIVAVSFTVLFGIFALFAVLGYFVFGAGVHSNILVTLPHTAWGHASRIAAATNGGANGRPQGSTCWGAFVDRRGCSTLRHL